MLKHFGAATVVMTALLAVFASGDEWGARAQVEAVEAKNQLVATEAEKFGTRRVAKSLKVADGVGASFGNDEPEIVGGVGGGGGYAAPALAQPVPSATPFAQSKPKPKYKANPLEPNKPPEPPGSDQAPGEFHADEAPAPSAQQVANITASSARRSGGSGSGD